MIGFLVCAALGETLVLAAARRGAARLDSQPWSLGDTAKLHVSIMAGLAGFAVTGIVLIAGLTRDKAGSIGSLDAVLMMFVVAYLYYIGNAFLISYAPDRETCGELVPRVHFSLASTTEYRTLFISWFALMPLFQTFGLEHPVRMLAILLPLSLLLGSVIIAMAADGLGLLHVKETYLSLIVGTALALGYALVQRLAAPGMAGHTSVLTVTLILFCVNGIGFALAAASPLSSRYPRLGSFYARHGRSIVVADMQLTMCALAFLWLAISGWI